MIWIYQMPLDKEEGKRKREAEKEAGRRLLHKGLASLYGIDLKNDVLIERGEHGKPYLAEFSRIHYNISHTDKLAVCGIGDMELGIDVERMHPYKESIFKRVLSEAEREKTGSLSEEERLKYFFRIWTLKESYGKALGCGLSMPLWELSFEFGPGGEIRCSQPGVFCFQTVLQKEYVLSVCTFEKTSIVLC